MSAPSGVRLLDRAVGHADRVAIRDERGAHRYEELLEASERVARALLRDRADLQEARVAFLAAPGAGYVAAQWGIWRAGGIAVPLCTSHPPPELAYVLDDTGAEAVLADAEHAGRVRPLAEERGLRSLALEQATRCGAADEASGRPDGAAADPPLPRLAPDRRAMILYTSGTTSRPKGVVTTHANLEAQVTSLVRAWEWTAEDRILHVLPLHHTHGIVNALLCALWVGATCEMLPRFGADRVWDRMGEGADGGTSITLFMAVPTIYVKLISAWERRPPESRTALGKAAGRLRLMVSGSAALPVPTFERWREITGHALLERYGMTEIGMALSNPLRGERRPGTVGQPLPGVEARLVDDEGRVVGEEGVSGEIEVRGPAVFGEYWGRPDATREAFREGGWFRTGDLAVVEDGYWRILGRRSVDIINTGGYKVSALEVEAVLRGHPGIADCAVVAVADPEWGERVCAAVVPSASGAPATEALGEWTRERLAAYKLPRGWLLVDELPRNAMGKVTKPAVQAMFREKETR